MKPDVVAALERLFASAGEAFDQVIRTLNRNRTDALPALVDLLKHPDPGWRLRAAAALGRMREAPRRAMPDLLRLLRSDDAGARVAAISAMDWLPADARKRCVPAVIRVLNSQPRAGFPPFTMGRANVPRSIAAHFLATHGGVRGVAALRRAARRRNDPVLYQIEAALECASQRARRRKQVRAAIHRARTR